MCSGKKCEDSPLRVKVEGGTVEEVGGEHHEDAGEQVVEEEQQVWRVVLLDICSLLG